MVNNYTRHYLNVYIHTLAHTHNCQVFLLYNTISVSIRMPDTIFCVDSGYTRTFIRNSTSYDITIALQYRKRNTPPPLCAPPVH